MYTGHCYKNDAASHKTEDEIKYFDEPVKNENKPEKSLRLNRICWTLDSFDDSTKSGTEISLLLVATTLANDIFVTKQVATTVQNK